MEDTLARTYCEVANIPCRSSIIVGGGAAGEIAFSWELPVGEE